MTQLKERPAQHYVLLGRRYRERSALASLALTPDTAILTDYGYEKAGRRVVSRRAMSSSASRHPANSANVLRAMELANERGAVTIGLTGAGGALRSLVRYCLSVPSRSTARIQEAHLLLGHLLCEWVGAAFVNDA